MTKEKYFDMMEQLRSEPIDSEIPIELDDLPFEVQEAYQVYNTLSDNWEGMSGSYLGKNMAGIKDVMDILDIEDKANTLQLIMLIDNYRAQLLNIKKSQKPASD